MFKWFSWSWFLKVVTGAAAVGGVSGGTAVIVLQNAAEHAAASGDGTGAAIIATVGAVVGAIIGHKAQKETGR